MVPEAWVVRRVPIACCLEEGGSWIPWRIRYLNASRLHGRRVRAPIRLYANGLIEDDIYQRAMRRSLIRRTTTVDMTSDVEHTQREVITQGRHVSKRRERLSPHQMQRLRHQIGI